MQDNNENFLKWVYSIKYTYRDEDKKIYSKMIFKDACIRYSKRIGSNFIIVDEVELNLQYLFEEKPKILFKSKGRVLNSFYKNPENGNITIFTDKGESFEISKKENEILKEI